MYTTRSLQFNQNPNPSRTQPLRNGTTLCCCYISRKASTSIYKESKSWEGLDHWNWFCPPMDTLLQKEILLWSNVTWLHSFAEVVRINYILGLQILDMSDVQIYKDVRHSVFECHLKTGEPDHSKTDQMVAILSGQDYSNSLTIWKLDSKRSGFQMLCI